LKRVLIALALSLCLIGVVAAPAAALEQPIGATVSVNAFSSFTITDNGTEGLSFTASNPGAVNIAEANSPSITVSAAPENNQTGTVSIKGVDFASGGNTIPIGNAKWDKDSDVAGATAMTTSYVVVGTLTAGTSLSIYHWLSIPNGQASGAYTSTFTYQAQ